MVYLERVIKVSLTHDCYDWLLLSLTILIPIITAIVNIIYINRNTNKQIANQNKQTYRPRLIVNFVYDKIKNNNEKILFARSSSKKKNKEIDFQIDLKNIGNGIASEISFYSLNSGRKCTGYQFNDINKNQKLESTREIASGEIDSFNFNVEYGIIYNDEKIIKNRDNLLLLCNYKDLNDNNYYLLIGIIVKESKTTTKLDYYYYQGDTKIFNDTINEYNYKENYNKIIKDITSKKQTIDFILY